MNVNELIQNSLAPLNLPVFANVYTGSAADYITFNYADERPILYADDVDEFDETTIQVHYFTQENPQAMKKQIRKLLRQNGFSIESTQELYERDTKYNHVVVYANIESYIDD